MSNTSLCTIPTTLASLFMHRIVFITVHVSVMQQRRCINAAIVCISLDLELEAAPGIVQ